MPGGGKKKTQTKKLREAKHHLNLTVLSLQKWCRLSREYLSANYKNETLSLRSKIEFLYL